MYEIAKEDKKDDICKALAMAVFEQALDDYTMQKIFNTAVRDKTILDYIKAKNDWEKYINGINKCIARVENNINICFRAGKCTFENPSTYELIIYHKVCNKLHEYIKFQSHNRKHVRPLKITLTCKKPHKAIHFPI